MYHHQWRSWSIKFMLLDHIYIHTHHIQLPKPHHLHVPLLLHLGHLQQLLQSLNEIESIHFNILSIGRIFGVKIPFDSASWPFTKESNFGIIRNPVKRLENANGTLFFRVWLSMRIFNIGIEKLHHRVAWRQLEECWSVDPRQVGLRNTRQADARIANTSKAKQLIWSLF